MKKELAMQAKDPKLRYHFALVVALLTLLGLGHEWVNPWLAFDRAAIEQGQWWRLLTCHWVHLNHWHLLLNMSGLLLCGYFFSDLLDRTRFWVWLILNSAVTGLLMFFLDGQLQHYVGLSGALHGLLIFCLLVGLKAMPLLHGVALCAIGARLISEQSAGYDVTYMQDWINGNVYVNAHLYGALVGVVLAVFFLVVAARHSSAKQGCNEAHKEENETC